MWDAREDPLMQDLMLIYSGKPGKKTQRKYTA